MSEIHYFPRTVQREEIVLTNTMMLFRRLYHHDAERFNRFLNLLIENAETDGGIDMSLKFRSQQAGAVLDGSISQDSFKVVIETKPYSQHQIGHIRHHFASFRDEMHQLFLWINPDPIDLTYKQIVLDEISDFNAANRKGIKFATITFKDLCHLLRSMIADHEMDLVAMADDYEDFCATAGLVKTMETKLRVVPTGASFEQHMNFHVYYDRRVNPYQPHSYIGLYKDKAVRGIGKITCIADIDYNRVTYSLIKASILEGTLSQQMEFLLMKVIKDAKQKYGFDLTTDYRFFFVDGFYPTYFRKDSPYGIMGKRYIDLESIGGYHKNFDTSEIAEVLTGKGWK